MTDGARPELEIIRSLTEEQARAGLGATKAVATKDGREPMSDAARGLLATTQAVYLQTDFDLDALEIPSPEHVAEVIDHPLARQDLLDGLIITTYMDPDVSADRVEVVDRYADALGLDAHADMRDLHHVAEGQMMELQYCRLRKTFAHTMDTVDGGWVARHGAVARQIAKAIVTTDPRVAKRYRALGTLPEGTLGRSLFDFYRNRGWPLPGERGSMAEEIMRHDSAHLIGGYQTNMAGEMGVTSWSAANCRDPRVGNQFIMIAILDFNCGINYEPLFVKDPQKGIVLPEILMGAWVRGAETTVDIFDERSWNPEENFERDVEDLRVEVGVRDARPLEELLPDYTGDYYDPAG